MSINYKIEDTSYNISYKELREEYFKHIFYTDEEFMENLPSALHLASIICWFKEISTEVCLSDKGIIHELIHLLHCPSEPTVVLDDIRELFKNQLVLS